MGFNLLGIIHAFGSCRVNVASYDKLIISIDDPTLHPVSMIFGSTVPLDKILITAFFGGFWSIFLIKDIIIKTKCG